MFFNAIFGDLCLSSRAPSRPEATQSNPEIRGRGGLLRGMRILRWCPSVWQIAVSVVLVAPCTEAADVDASVRDGSTVYTEDLSIQRLGQRHVAARFVFRSEWIPYDRHRCQAHEDWDGDGGDGGEDRRKLCHFEAGFPRAVGVLVDRFKVRQLSLQMSKGRWDTAAWGNGAADGRGYTAGGAELWARLPADGAWEHWVGLRRGLSGLYCSSLDGMDESRVHAPSVLAMPGDSGFPPNETTILRATLPREPLCTENLTPLIKMLPCRSKAGLARLLRPTRIFQSDYHSMSVRVEANFSRETVSGGDGTSIASVSLEQTVVAVFRNRQDLPGAVSEKSKSSKGSSNSKADDATGRDWSLASLLLPPEERGRAARSGADTLQGCPVASRSAIHVHEAFGGRAMDGDDGEATCDVSSANCEAHEGGAASPRVLSRSLLKPAAGTASLQDSSKATADFLEERLWATDVFEASTTWEEEPRDVARDGAAVVSSDTLAARLDHFLAGRGGTRGVSVSHVVNMSPSRDAYAEFMQPVPYFMVPLVGTLRARVVISEGLGSREGISAHGLHASADQMPMPDDLQAGNSNAPGPRLPLAHNVTFTPGDKRSPALLEARLWVPAASTVVLGFDFYKRFLTVDEFPPDPSRGFDVPPPIARLQFADLGTTCLSGDDGEVENKRVGAASCAAREEATGRTGHERTVYIYGESGLVDIPQLDFSMPFNVITFTSTVITFFLGTVINLLVRKSARDRKKKNGKGNAPGLDDSGGVKTEGDAADDQSRGNRRLFHRLREACRSAIDSVTLWRRHSDAARIHREGEGASAEARGDH